ncbi:GTP-binding protein [Candidatus Woesearchaeota archaeon]|nr:GTP-binding protein [Candidatus Woesearchaeota archaeon]
MTIQEQIKEFEKELSTTKYNKKTQHHIGLVKAKIAKLRQKMLSGSKKKKGEGYSVRKTGDGTVILLGFPSVGKSTLLNALTNANSAVGSYNFTTLDVVPGLMKYNYAKIQVLDVPGIVKGAADGTGRGREVLAVMRSADLAVIIIDVNKPEEFSAIMKEVHDSGIRLNQRMPDVKISKKGRGGIRVGATLKLTKLSKETIKSIAGEFGIINADIVIREDIDEDQLIDVIEGNRHYIPSIIVINKIDMVDEELLEKIIGNIRPDLCISATKKQYIEKLREMIFDKLGLIRIYLKEVGKEADLVEPLIMFKDCSIEDVCDKLHRDFVKKFKFARIWGSSKFPGQKQMLKYRLKDKDILEIHMS